MTDTFKVRITASEDFGVVEFDIPASSPVDARGKITSGEFAELVNEAIHQQTLIAKALKAAHGLTPEPETATVLSAWGQEPTQPVAQPAQPPAWAQQPSNVVPITQQGGRVCTACGQPLIVKQTSAGKNVWRCEQWRWNNGNPNNHTSLKPGEGF